MTLSFIGHYEDSQEYFDTCASNGNFLPLPSDLSLLTPRSAITEILRHTVNKQVVMINEAHHVPETRALPFAMLEPLFEQGYRYLALETFDEEGLKLSQAKGFPLQPMGWFTTEPLMGDFVRKAMRIGYQLVAYEHNEPCDYEKFPIECQDKRERGQAQHLIDRILKKDPQSKIFVHAGYGHVDKIGPTPTFPWIPMAKYFKEFSGIDPFTLDQVEFRSRHLPKAESTDYRRLLKQFQIEEPTVLMEGQKLWTALPGHFDAHVILPDSLHENRLPDWVVYLTQRQIVVVDWSRCAHFPCLIQAAFKGEETENFIPVHQLYAPTAQETPPFFWLPSGEYVFRYLN